MKTSLKTLAFLALSTSMFAAFNATASDLACPQKTKTLTKCTAATKAGDSIFAVGAMDEAVVCQKADKKMLIIIGINGEISPASEGVKLISTTGATNYSVTEDGVEYVLSRTSKTGAGNAKFTIYYPGDQKASRTLTCK